ncbi:hypothetical protein TNCV_3216001 [Trichonephila clavipes]|nr:hypothetical protein TNCV_3216001 [Trichonephila clavipes]
MFGLNKKEIVLLKEILNNDSLKNILKTILHPEHVYAFCLQSGPSKLVLRMSFIDESIRNVGERDSSKPFSPIPQAATPFVSSLRRNQMVSGQHSPQTPPSSRENFF